MILKETKMTEKHTIYACDLVQTAKFWYYTLKDNAQGKLRCFSTQRYENDPMICIEYLNFYIVGFEYGFLNPVQYFLYLYIKVIMPNGNKTKLVNRVSNWYYFSVPICDPTHLMKKVKFQAFSSMNELVRICVSFCYFIILKAFSTNRFNILFGKNGQKLKSFHTFNLFLKKF